VLSQPTQRAQPWLTASQRATAVHIHAKGHAGALRVRRLTLHHAISTRAPHRSLCHDMEFDPTSRGGGLGCTLLVQKGSPSPRSKRVKRACLSKRTAFLIYQTTFLVIDSGMSSRFKTPHIRRRRFLCPSPRPHFSGLPFAYLLAVCAW